MAQFQYLGGFQRYISRIFIFLLLKFNKKSLMFYLSSLVLAFQYHNEKDQIFCGKCDVWFLYYYDCTFLIRPFM